MAKYSIEDTTLTNIADAIREKNGETTQYNPVDMPAAIAAIQGGGGTGDLETFTITGDASYALSNGTKNFTTSYNKVGQWNIYRLAIVNNLLKTENINKLMYFCQGMTTIDELPFEINMAPSGNYSSTDDKLYMQGAFYNTSLRKLPKINFASDVLVQGDYLLDQLCRESKYLEDVSALAAIPSAYCQQKTFTGYTFYCCYALRSIPVEFWRVVQNSYQNLNYAYKYTLNGCRMLDEILEFPVINLTSTSSNMFSDTFTNCTRAKRMTFAVKEDGTPYSKPNWTNQTINLFSLGYGNGSTSFDSYYKYSTTITEDKKVTDDASYQALKDDPDWFCVNSDYSRYNKISAIETISTLPTVGSGCTIKFSANAGLKTDGGNIGSLTEEEIAVAAAKGWTVTLA